MADTTVALITSQLLRRHRLKASLGKKSVSETTVSTKKLDMVVSVNPATQEV
jgi:hypothetical protein